MSGDGVQQMLRCDCCFEWIPCSGSKWVFLAAMRMMHLVLLRRLVPLQPRCHEPMPTIGASACRCRWCLQLHCVRCHWWRWQKGCWSGAKSSEGSVVSLMTKTSSKIRRRQFTWKPCFDTSSCSALRASIQCPSSSSLSWNSTETV